MDLFLETGEINNAMKRSPMKPSAKPMSRGKPMKKRRKVRPKVDGIDYLALCRWQRCYLQCAPACASIDTVVPCHSNQQIHGKGMGLKASDQYTVPGCQKCHTEIDQGKRFSKAQKFEIWDSAYSRWVIDREEILKGKL